MDASRRCSGRVLFPTDRGRYTAFISSSEEGDGLGPLPARGQRLGMHFNGCAHGGGQPRIFVELAVAQEPERQFASFGGVGVGSIYVPHPYEYSGADELVVFRILSAGEDGSVTLLWKRLQKFTPPKLEERRDDTATRERSDNYCQSCSIR